METSASKSEAIKSEVSNQPARFFATAKTHKFDDYSSINVKNLKLRPIIDQSNTFTYNAAKIVSDYLQPLAQNEYVIKDTLLFAEIIKNDTLDPDEEYVSYDVESLFTSIPVSETIDYIIKEIYENKVIKPMCKSKLIFRRLLEKLTIFFHLKYLLCYPHDFQDVALGYKL